MAKQIKVEEKKSISQKFVHFAQNESDSNIPMLTPAWQSKLVCWESILKYSNNFLKKGAGDDLLGDDLLEDDLLSDDSLAHINSNTNMDTKAKSKPNE